ncbi:MAG: hypothetical protein AAF138_02665 [Planctomycetota bacterium]
MPDETDDIAPADTPSTRTGNAVPPVIWSDLASDLIWPKLLRAPALGLHPGRLALAYIVVLAVYVLGSIGAAWSGDGLPALVGLIQRIEIWLEAGFVWGPGPWIVLGCLVPLSALLLAWLGGALGRSAAEDYARIPRGALSESGVSRCGVRGSTAKAFRRFVSLFIALWAAPVAVLAVTAGCAGLARLLMMAPYVDVLGVLVAALAIAVAGLAFVALLAYILTLPMLAPAMMCEASDGIDAVQRIVAYTIYRPLKTLLYTGLLWTLTVGVAWLALRCADYAYELSKWISGVATRRASDELTAPAAWLAVWAIRAVLLAPFAIGLSILFSGGAAAYLALREACDGQDPSDLAPL